MAREAGMDLVEVAPAARPPVCKIMDYGKWRYQQQKKEDRSRANSKGGQLKELKLRTVKIGDNDLMDLKKAGVSPKVIAAMLEASVLTSPVVKVDGNPVELHTLGQAKVGGRLGSALTGGIKSVKQKAYLQGQHAAVVASRNPNIEIELPPNDTADNYILVIMDAKGDRRELETGASGGAVGGKSGIRAESVIQTSAEPLGSRRFKITPHEAVKSGEYILYVVGSADFQKGIFGKGYDFTIE